MRGNLEKFKAFTQSSGLVFDSKLAAHILEASPIKTAKILCQWTKQGLISRISQGLYAVVPINVIGSEFAPEDPWIIASKLFPESYIGGCSALEFFDLTEQIFNTVFVFTTKRVPHKRFSIQGIPFLVRHISKNHLFGLAPVWRGELKVMVSDIHRTLIDIFDDLENGGGLLHASDTLKQYLKHPDHDLEKLKEYLLRFKNRTIFKRIGFLLSIFLGKTNPKTEAFKAEISKGYSYLDPHQKDKVKLITEWNLFVPEGFEENLA
jgi:predicted transcriptional regulator of viral defense system